MSMSILSFANLLCSFSGLSERQQASDLHYPSANIVTIVTSLTEVEWHLRGGKKTRFLMLFVLFFLLGFPSYCWTKCPAICLWIYFLLARCVKKGHSQGWTWVPQIFFLLVTCRMYILVFSSCGNFLLLLYFNFFVLLVNGAYLFI